MAKTIALFLATITTAVAGETQHKGFTVFLLATVCYALHFGAGVVENSNERLTP